jgi:hypothetical protein
MQVFARASGAVCLVPRYTELILSLSKAEVGLAENACVADGGMAVSCGRRR